LLNIGSDAVDLQRGFARLNRSLAAWTLVRPGKIHPNVADFHRAFEKPWHQCFLPRGGCDVIFGRSLVQTLLKRGLVELLPKGTASLPSMSTTVHGPPTALATAASSAVKRRGASKLHRNREDVLALMCRRDIVVFESGIEDFALPVTAMSPLRDPSLLIPACSGRTAEDCAAALSSALRNETWRNTPLSAYRDRMLALMQVWRGCKKVQPHWRGIFKLALAPRARALRERPEAADCERGQTGFSADPHHVEVINRVARSVVERAGFEVFDPWAVTLHAKPSWFDALPKARGLRKPEKGSGLPAAGLEFEVHSAEAVSDLITQALLNQICSRN
jgi:hypothetical protein